MTTLSIEETTQTKLTYPQQWSAYNEAQTSEVRLFDELLRDLVEGIEEPEQHMGRPRLPLKEQAFCAIQKVYSQLSSRRASSLFKNAEEKYHITHAPHFNTISNFLKKEESTPILENLIAITSRPLAIVETDFAVDASGFSTTNFNEYCKYKHRHKKVHSWVTANICVGVKTNIITSVEIKKENANESPGFAALVKKTKENGFTIEEVSADKGYISKKNLQAVKDVGGMPYIPFKSNSTSYAYQKKIWKRMLHYFLYRQEEFMEHYHKRSNVETTFHMIKTKFGEKLKSKTFTSQKNELLCKMIAHNIVVLIHEMYELGIEPDFHL
jgi:transposase